MVTVPRHFAWFNIESGEWLGEWAGLVPAPEIPHTVVGDARRLLLNQWQQSLMPGIVPSVRDEDAWDDCPDGGAVCLDVTRFQRPLGDLCWHWFNASDQSLEAGEPHRFLQINRTNLHIDAHSESARPVRSTPDKWVVDVTGTLLAADYQNVTGFLRKRAGRWTLEPEATRVLDVAPVDLDLSQLITVSREAVHVRNGV